MPNVLGQKEKNQMVLQALLWQAVGNQGPTYVKVPYSLIKLDQRKTIVGKCKENPDKAETLLERSITHKTLTGLI